MKTMPSKVHRSKSHSFHSCLLLAALALWAHSARLAAQESPPYPPSPIISRIEWAPVESIIRQAKGSDNWPLTWGDDNHLYTAYGDGVGFDLKMRPKLSLGFARILGEPPQVTGENLRAPTGEFLGDGMKGKKASGLIMVEGTLYVWVRNAGNAQLGWSTDHARTWQWADWKLSTSFGCPTFLNYGQNYRGARDEYVYVYSHDADSAYEPADRMVLARVPKSQIADQSRYEFYRNAGPNSAEPAWTRNVAERGAVFAHPGRCYRSSVTYNAGLKRYFWCQTLPGSDARFAGGFAIYDAPEPWGKWTTAYFAEKWDVGPGETSSFPTKWMTADGKSMYLVFSGNDCFSVRQATIILR